MKIKEYTFKSATLEHLQEKTNGFLNAGWEAFESIVSDGGEYCQKVRPRKEPNTLKTNGARYFILKHECKYYLRNLVDKWEKQNWKRVAEMTQLNDNLFVQAIQL